MGLSPLSRLLSAHQNYRSLYFMITYGTAALETPCKPVSPVLLNDTDIQGADTYPNYHRLTSLKLSSCTSMKLHTHTDPHKLEL